MHVETRIDARWAACRSSAFAALSAVMLLATAFCLPIFAQDSPDDLAPGDAARGDAADEPWVIEDIVAWVNDDIITYTELAESEQLAMLQAQQQGISGDALLRQVGEIQKRTLVDLINKRLLVQEAERLYDIDAVKTDLIKRFRESRDIKSDAELDELLQQYGKDRDLFADELVMNYAPNMVIQTQVMDSMAVSEEMARKYYDEHRSEYGTAAVVTFREVFLEAEGESEKERRRQEIEDLAARAQQGEDFIALVQEASESPSKALDGKIGPFETSDLAPELAQAAETVPVGGVSSPVATSRGWHLIKVLEREDAVVPDFEELRNRIEDAINQKRFEKTYLDFVTELWKSGQIEVRRTYAGRLIDPWRDLAAIR